jgi:hypothetical protein
VHKADKQFAIEYSYAGKKWGTEVWAEDEDDAWRKLRAMSNGQVLGECFSIPIPGGGFLARLLAWFK